MNVKGKIAIVLGLAAAGVALAWLIVPRTSEKPVGPLTWVERPERRMPCPHPAEQFDGPGVFVSDFVDIGQSARLEVGDTGVPLFFRTAHHTRSFRITRPPDGDREALEWQRVPAKPFAARRFVQFAAPVPRSEGERGIVIRVRWTYRPGLWSWVLIVTVAVAIDRLRGPRLRSIWSGMYLRLRKHWTLLGAAVLAALAFAAMWETVVHPDEFFTVDMARGVLSSGEYVLDNFAYPHVPVYLQVLGTMAYGILQSVAGLCYHDPYSNQLYFDGRVVAPTPRLLFDPESFPAWIFDTSLPWVRRGYAVGSALMIVLASAVAGRARSARAGFFAALAVAVQPLLMNAQILPNAMGATIALGTAWVFITAPASDGWTLVKGCLAGVMVAWKYNPAFGVVLVGLVLLESPPARRLPRLAIALAGLPVGFLAVYPSMPWRLREFMGGVAQEAHHYAWGGHPQFEADAPLALVLHGVFVRPQLPGNYLVLFLAGIGAYTLARRSLEREGRIASWVLLATPVLATAFLWEQMVQFGRNYTIPLAMTCVLSGVGSDAALKAVERCRLARILLTAVILAGVGSVGVQHWWREKDSMVEPSARRQAISWVDRNASLGSAILLVESLGRLEGVLPDQSRFRVRRGEFPGESRDYVIAAGGVQVGFDRKPAVAYEFKGRGVSGGTETYRVFRLAPPPEAEGRKQPNE